MRLLDAKTYRLVEYPDTQVPKYTILSHRWQEEEVLFTDIQCGEYRHKRGFQKIYLACAQTVKDGFEYIWIDTCGIDKSSSAELSEAINSMFAWYQRAAICYVYLADVNLGADALHPSFAVSEWFERGWTLQELLAPATVRFYTSFWTYLGSRSDLRDVLSRITNIDPEILHAGDEDGEGPQLETVRLKRLFMCSNAKRMSWAATRKTSRVEDRAYSLLGLFNVNMPLLYGEGSKAFIRLQEEIIKTSKDLSIFAWDAFESESNVSDVGLDWFNENPLAPTPDFFIRCSTVVVSTSGGQSRSPLQTAFTMSKQGIHIENARLHMIESFDLLRGDPGRGDSIQRAAVSLECRYSHRPARIIALSIWRKSRQLHSEDKSHGDGNQEWHIYPAMAITRESSRLTWIDILSLHTCSPRPYLTIKEPGHVRKSFINPLYTHIWVKLSPAWEVKHADPEKFWSPGNVSFDLKELRGAAEILGCELKIVLDSQIYGEQPIHIRYRYMGYHPYKKNDVVTFSIGDNSTDAYSSSLQQTIFDNGDILVVKLAHVEREDVCVAAFEITVEKKQQVTEKWRTQMRRMRHSRLPTGSNESS